MRPLVHPALARVWRDPTTVQIGLDPARALVLGGLDTPETTVLRSVNGRRDEAMLRRLAHDAGGDPAVADRLLEVLREAGVVVDGDRAGTASADDDPHAPDRASLGLLTGSPDGGDDGMAARRNRWVEVRGAGRVGSAVARLLGAAGVGRTTVDDAEPATAHDVTPGGLSRRHVGHPRGRAVRRLLGRSQEPVAEPANPALVVLAPPPGTVSVAADGLLGAGVPHLVARVVEVTGVVGPLVVPGRSSCLRCHDLHRAERDPAWPRVVAQVEHQPPRIAACDVALAALVAALATQQALAWLDGFTPATVDGTVEVSLPYGLPRRRSWRPHPACGCRWSQQS